MLRCENRSRSRDVRNGRAIAWSALLFILLFPSELLAVPAFARRYETSCATCHQAFPRLNAVGESFRLAGFRFVDEERYRKVQPVELGDEAVQETVAPALWPTDVPSHVRRCRSSRE